MPTINQLGSVLAVADNDYLPVSQAGITRRVTRAQLLAGYQPAVALASGTLLGRSSPGVGSPEAMAVGAHLTLRNGVLSASAPFSVQTLPAGHVVAATDLVAASQGGLDQSVSVRALLSSLPSVPGIDLSGQMVRAGPGPLRALSDWVGDAVSVEAFGAIGDGVTDDTAAIDRAVGSGWPVRFGPKTYVVNGQWTVLRTAVLIGVPGLTVLLRRQQAGGAWISVRGPCFEAFGIRFDAGSLAGESWGVLIEAPCSKTLFETCIFQHATGAVLGCGLTIAARDGLSGSPSQHVVRGCRAFGNDAHGIWIQAAAGAVVEGCVAHENGAYGICLDFNDPAFLQKVRHGSVSGCEAWGNRRGISIGNYNETNLEPPRWGNENPDAVGVVVSGNRCHDNTDYGIAAAGQALQIGRNLLEANGSGLLLNASFSTVGGNMIVGPGQFGIDAGGCIDCDLVDNMVRGFAVGINPGGSRSVRVAANALVGNVWAVTVYGVETDGRGNNFGIVSTGLVVEQNRIVLKDGSGGGVFLIDAPQGVLIAGNAFSGGSNTSPSQALWAHTDQVTVRDNLWNNQASMIFNPVSTGGQQQIQFPDILDGVMVTSVSPGQAISSLVGQHQAGVAGQITFAKLTSGGSGYTQASVVISGSGSGATAIAYVRDGAVVGIAMQSAGSGYGAAAVTVTIRGDGQGALASAFSGLPVPDGRRLRVHCNSPVRFKRVGSAPFQDNWTGTDVLVPQASVIEWAGAWGGWQAVTFTLADYIMPAGDGSLAIRSIAGDVVMHPGGTGHVRVASDQEPVGFASLLGRGSPEGAVAAPAGSDYRNLDGGAMATMWIKHSGAGVSGWTAIA